jgi:hypothetical protein
MAHAPLTRIVGLVGWAFSLLVLSAVSPEPVRACVIFVDELAALTTPEFAAGPIEAWGVWDRDQQDALRAPSGPLAGFTLTDAAADTADDPGHGGSPPRPSNFAPGLDVRVALNDLDTGNGPDRPDLANGSDAIGGFGGDSDIVAVALRGAYDALNSFDSDIAATALGAYHALGRLDRNIEIAVRETYDAIGLRDDAGAAGFGAVNKGRMVGNTNGPVGWLLEFERFLFSRDSVPYFIIIAIVYLAFEGLRKLTGQLR